MKFRKKALIILSVLMGVVWVLLFVVQLHLTSRVFYKEKQLFHTKVNVAAENAFERIETSPLIFLDTAPSLEHLTFEEYYPFIKLPPGFSSLVNARLDYISKTKPCLNYRYIDTLLIDSVFTRSLHEQLIFDAFEWGVYCTEDAKFLYASSNADTSMMRSSGFDYPLLAYCYPDSFHHDIMYLLFPSLVRRYSWDMFVGIILLFILLIVILFCFAAIITLIYRESKNRTMRSNLMNHIIHEFKTPITTISLATQLLNDEKVQKDPETTRSYLGMIDAEAQSLQSLVEEVLTIFRAEKLPIKELHEISLHQLLHDAVNVHQLSLQDCGAKTIFDLQAKKDRIMGDPTHLMNAFSNLIDNAIKYRKEELEIVISTQNVDNMIEIRIKDNGIGISKDNQSLIFEPFSRVNLDNAQYVKGYGLGLSYVRYVVNYHGGIIKVKSDLGKGATFIVSLPTKF